MKRQWQPALALIALLIIAGVMFQSESLAQNVITIKPGKYLIESKTRTSYDNSLSKKSEERCIQGNSLRPQVFLPDREKCTIQNLKETGKSATFDMTCQTPNGANLKGHVEYSSSQETNFKYKLNMKGPFQNQEVEISAEGDAKWVGDC